MGSIARKYGRVIAPLGFLLLVGSVQLLALFGFILSPSTFLDRFAASLSSGTLWLIAICSFLEGIAGFNIFFPGSVVILYSMAAAHGNVNRGLFTFTAIVLGSGLAHQLNYWAGRLFSGRLGKRISYRAVPSLGGALASYWHPHSGSLYSVRSGVDGILYGPFLFRFALAFGMWNLFWGVLMFQLGYVPIQSSEFMWIFYAYLGWWIYQEIKALGKRRNATEPQDASLLDPEATSPATRTARARTHWLR